MAEQDRADGMVVVGGVDTHRDTHVGAVVDSTGRRLGSAQFRADATGYGQLVAWMASWGRISRVGVEGCGSYGAGLARHLTGADIDVVEVMRPNRQLRRRRGKDDYTDAEAAARAALSGEATAVPTSGDGPVEWTRMLTVTRRSAVKARTQAANQLHALVVGAPEPTKDQPRGHDAQSPRPGVCPLSDPAENPPSAKRSRLSAAWPSDTGPSTPRSQSSMSRSAVSAPRPTRPCWPPAAWAPTQPPSCWSQPATILSV